MENVTFTIFKNIGLGRNTTLATKTGTLPIKGKTIEHEGVTYNVTGVTKRDSTHYFVYVKEATK